MDYLVRAFIRFLESYHMEFEVKKENNKYVIDIFNIPSELDIILTNLHYVYSEGFKTVYDWDKRDLVNDHIERSVMICEDTSEEENIFTRVVISKNDYAVKLNKLTCAIKAFYEEHSDMY